MEEVEEEDEEDLEAAGIGTGARTGTGGGAVGSRQAFMSRPIQFPVCSGLPADKLRSTCTAVTLHSPSFSPSFTPSFTPFFSPFLSTLCAVGKIRGRGRAKNDLTHSICDKPSSACTDASSMSDSTCRSYNASALIQEFKVKEERGQRRE